MREFNAAPADTSQAVVLDAALPANRGVFVGTGGTIVGRLKGDANDTTWKNCPSGQERPLIFTVIRTAGTTAADMLILF